MRAAPHELPLHQRSRAPTAAELASVHWLKLLDAAERERATAHIRVADALPGEFVCRVGRNATFWFGVIEGLLKMSSDDAQGRTTTFAGVPPGGWFGEGTVLKRETYRYNIQPLRKSVVAGLDVDTFHWLLDHSLGFNRFLMNQLNERLGQFIAGRETDRMSNPDRRGRGIAHHSAGAGVPRGPVAPAGQRGARGAGGAGRDPRGVRRHAHPGPGGAHAAVLRWRRDAAVTAGDSPPPTSGGSAGRPSAG